MINKKILFIWISKILPITVLKKLIFSNFTSLFVTNLSKNPHQISIASSSLSSSNKISNASKSNGI